MNGFGPPAASRWYFSAILYIAGCEASGTSHLSARDTVNARRNSSAMVGTSVLFTRGTPGFTPRLPTMITSSVRPPSVTFIVHVVQPRVWPGVRCAMSVVPPSVTVSPS